MPVFVSPQTPWQEEKKCFNAFSPARLLFVDDIEKDSNVFIVYCYFTYTFKALLHNAPKSTFVEGDSNISLWYIKIR